VSRQYKPKAGFWIRLCVVVLLPLDGTLFRIRWHHLQRMPDPADTGVIIVANHISHIDTVLMALGLEVTLRRQSVVRTS